MNYAFYCTLFYYQPIHLDVISNDQNRMNNRLTKPATEKHDLHCAPSHWPPQLWILVMLVAQAEPMLPGQYKCLWSETNGVEIQWRGRITVCYRGTVCNQWEFLNVTDSVNCMPFWAAMSYWDYSAQVYLTFITPWNSMVRHVVIPGLCAEHLFLSS